MIVGLKLCCPIYLLLTHVLQSNNYKSYNCWSGSFSSSFFSQETVTAKTKVQQNKQRKGKKITTTGFSCYGSNAYGLFFFFSFLSLQISSQNIQMRARRLILSISKYRLHWGELREKIWGKMVHGFCIKAVLEVEIGGWEGGDELESEKNQPTYLLCCHVHENAVLLQIFSLLWTLQKEILNAKRCS